MIRPDRVLGGLTIKRPTCRAIGQNFGKNYGGDTTGPDVSTKHPGSAQGVGQAWFDHGTEAIEEVGSCQIKTQPSDGGISGGLD